MATGCAIVASSTAPVAEVIVDGANGCLCDFFDRAGLVSVIEALLDDPSLRRRLGQTARETVVAGYDFRTRILPSYRQMLVDLQ
jgi:glycosyltransferase involved in cell wall biosynthesis